jgi:4'-phosphopantetheinyl transferase
MMAHILVARCSATCYIDLVRTYEKHLPKSIIQKAHSFRFEIDSCRFLLGKILLLTGAGRMGYAGLNLHEMRMDKYHKPYFTNGLNFNISHSGDYILCVLSTENKVGIDLEEIRPLDTTCYASCFTDQELLYLNNSGQLLKSFYHLWTRKEAVIKADGRGMTMPLLNFDVVRSPVIVDNNTWYLKEVPVAAGYSAHLAIDADIDHYTIDLVF